MVKKRKRKSDIDKLFDLIDAGVEISQNIKETVDNVKGMLGLNDDEVLLARERYLDGEILRLQEELYGTRRTAQVPPPISCPVCGGPHKSYEHNDNPEPSAKPAPTQKTMTVERAVSVLGLSEDVMNKSPKEFMVFLRGRYRELALIWHPDVGGTGQKMSEINTAYFFLKDIAERRAKSRSGNDANSSR
jgi:hypothetical protein